MIERRKKMQVLREFSGPTHTQRLFFVLSLKMCTFVQKTREINGNHLRKRAFGRFGRLLLVSYSIATGRMLVLSRKSLIHLFCECRSRFLRLSIRGRDLFCFKILLLSLAVLQKPQAIKHTSSSNDAAQVASS